jgi:multisubunit Na+/H+ antiporter MnhB subunit
MLWRRILADLLVVIHATYVGFVVIGLVAILTGVVFRWKWVRNPWFRWIHISMIGIVVAEALAGIPCPLTVWERQLRAGAGQIAYAGDFIGYWTHRFIFYEADPWVFTAIYTVFGLAVLAALILAPPRWRAGDHRLSQPGSPISPGTSH